MLLSLKTQHKSENLLSETLKMEYKFQKTWKGNNIEQNNLLEGIHER